MRQDRNLFYPRRDPEAGVGEDRERFLNTALVSVGLPSLFYASLRVPGLFEAVIGRPLENCHRELVALEGFHFAELNAGPGFPGILPLEAPHRARLDCLLVHDLTRFEQTMVAWYEWDEYALDRVVLADGRMAQVFLPDLDAIRREHGAFDIKPRSFEDWRSSHTDRAIADARAWMAQRPDDADLMEAGCFVHEDLPAIRRAAG